MKTPENSKTNLNDLIQKIKSEGVEKGKIADISERKKINIATYRTLCYSKKQNGMKKINEISGK